MNEASSRPDYSAQSLRDLAFFLARLALGIIFVAHGSQKLLGWFGGYGPSATIAMFAKSGIPPLLGWLDIIAEFFGGLGLIFGVLPRLSALGILIVMLVAVFKVHLQNGFFMNWGGVVLANGKAKPEGFEYHLLAMGIALIVLLAGPGRWSLLPDFEGRLVFGGQKRG